MSLRRESLMMMVSAREDGRLVSCIAWFQLAPCGSLNAGCWSALRLQLHIVDVDLGSQCSDRIVRTQPPRILVAVTIYEAGTAAMHRLGVFIEAYRACLLQCGAP